MISRPVISSALSASVLQSVSLPPVSVAACQKSDTYISAPISPSKGIRHRSRQHLSPLTPSMMCFCIGHTSVSARAISTGPICWAKA